MMPRTDILNDVVDDLRIASSFVTIVPVASSKPAADGTIARATWALPVAGLLVGLAGAASYALASKLGLTAGIAALLALATTTAITGALHEDGLADTADGLGGGRTRERKLEIMRDSRIGTFGVCALIASFALRWSALASIAAPLQVGAALIAAHVAARAVLPAFMRFVPPARPDGLSARAGQPPIESVGAAALLGVIVLGIAVGPLATLSAIILLALAAAFLAWLATRQIGGQTGDVLGAVEQTAEIIVLLIAASLAMAHA